MTDFDTTTTVQDPAITETFGPIPPASDDTLQAHIIALQIELQACRDLRAQDLRQFQAASALMESYKARVVEHKATIDAFLGPLVEMVLDRVFDSGAFTEAVDKSMQDFCENRDFEYAVEEAVSKAINDLSFEVCVR